MAMGLTAIGVLSAWQLLVFAKYLNPFVSSLVLCSFDTSRFSAIIFSVGCIERIRLFETFPAHIC